MRAPESLNEVSPARSGRECADAGCSQSRESGAGATESPVSASDPIWGLLLNLVFAARNLVNAQLGPRFIAGRTFCGECRRGERDGRIAHEITCRVGRVDEILEMLTAATADSNSKGKEAEEMEGGRSDVGMRAGGVRLAHAAGALRNAALEEIVQIPGTVTTHCNVCGSSVSGLDKTERAIVHGCDCWVGNALIVLEDAALDGAR